MTESTSLLCEMSISTATTIITAAVAVLVAIITGGQWLTNRARLRHELFDRRYALYQQIAGFIAKIQTSGRVPKGEPEEFLRRTKTAYFAFACDNDIKVLITEIHEKAVYLETLGKTLEPLDRMEYKKTIEDQRAVTVWLKNTQDSLEKRFEKYLKLMH